jgi:hypothetical protein
MNNIPTTKELAEEALRLLKELPMTSREHIEFLMRQGIIDYQGRVLCNRYFGDGPPPDADTPPPASPDSSKYAS